MWRTPQVTLPSPSVIRNHLDSKKSLLRMVVNPVSLVNPGHVVPTLYQPVSRPSYHIGTMDVRRTRRGADQSSWYRTTRPLVHFVACSPWLAAKLDSDYSRTFVVHSIFYIISSSSRGWSF
ncbi:hypothetical protein PAXINDRAFT_168930 [Paxillus involutus ATCC 200175]|uniref:Uncharacterized protein n=1 Tax=Paxillus involutus ATCC 200175 TaxID=664439 RepID=A0A0C9TJZ7_PAXIN|nr:hypothetical protein PAXINDRAFT_168930 [Paxillus involutus ATCC 200175]